VGGRGWLRQREKSKEQREDGMGSREINVMRLIQLLCEMGDKFIWKNIGIMIDKNKNVNINKKRGF
jgi:hypothetical protein